MNLRVVSSGGDYVEVQGDDAFVSWALGEFISLKKQQMHEDHAAAIRAVFTDRAERMEALRMAALNLSDTARALRRNVDALESSGFVDAVGAERNHQTKEQEKGKSSN